MTPRDAAAPAATGAIAQHSEDTGNGTRTVGAYARRYPRAGSLYDSQRWRLIDVALDDVELSAADRLVYLAIVRHTNGEGASWPKHSTMSRETGLSLTTVRKSLRSLERLGYFEKQPYLRPEAKGQGANIYRLSDRALEVARVSRGATPVGSQGCREATPQGVAAEHPHKGVAREHPERVFEEGPGVSDATPGDAPCGDAALPRSGFADPSEDIPL